MSADVEKTLSRPSMSRLPKRTYQVTRMKLGGTTPEVIVVEAHRCIPESGTATVAFVDFAGEDGEILIHRIFYNVYDVEWIMRDMPTGRIH